MCPDPLNGPSVLQVCTFNRTVSKVDDFLANEAKGTKVVGAKSLKEMVSMLKKPRRIILLVKAGQAVDDFIEKLVWPALFSRLQSLGLLRPLTVLLQRSFYLQFPDTN